MIQLREPSRSKKFTTVAAPPIGANLSEIILAFRKIAQLFVISLTTLQPPRGLAMHGTSLQLSPSDDVQLVARVISGNTEAARTLFYNHCSASIRIHADRFFPDGDYSPEEITAELSSVMLHNSCSQLRAWDRRARLLDYLESAVYLLCVERLRALNRLGPRVDDWDLVVRIVRDDRIASGELFLKRCAPRIRRAVGVYFSRGGYSAEELTNDLFASMAAHYWHGLRLWQGRAALTTFIDPAIVNLCLQRLKEFGRVRDLEPLEDQLLPGIPPADPTWRLTLMKAVQSLNTEDRLLIELLLSGSSGKEVAATMAISETAANVRLHRARKRLRERLIELGFRR